MFLFLSLNTLPRLLQVKANNQERAVHLINTCPVPRLAVRCETTVRERPRLTQQLRAGGAREIGGEGAPGRKQPAEVRRGRPVGLVQEQADGGSQPQGLWATKAQGSLWQLGGPQEIAPSFWPGSERVEKLNDKRRPCHCQGGQAAGWPRGLLVSARPLDRFGCERPIAHAAADAMGTGQSGNCF